MRNCIKDENEICIKIECFNLKYTLECGQCFRWKKSEKTDNEYVGVIKDRVIKIRQFGNEIYASSNKMHNLDEIIYEYFDLDEDYQKIEEEIMKIDDNVEKAILNTSGTRILNQDFFETLISYIISANNNIPRISKSIELIAKTYGEKVEFDNKDYFLFPTINNLKDISEEEFRKCGVGFRAKYIKNTIKKLYEENFEFDKIYSKTTSELKEKLLTFQGVGPKVSDCILLFSCGKKEAFPIDVWVERVMSNIYFKENKGAMNKKEILNYATKNFGKYAGIVQQHLFYNIREKKI